MVNRHRLLLAAAAVALAATPAAAQEFTLHTATTYKMGGVLGFAAKLGGAPKETLETTYLSGHRMRSDQQESATIIDADAGTITMLNKKNKTYTRMTFDEMADLMRQMQAKAAKPEHRQKNDSARVEMKYSAKVDVTKEQEKIAGFNAKRMFLTITMDAAAKPEGEDEMKQAGTLAILADMWNAQDAPHARAMKAFQEAYARKAAREFGSGARGMEAMFSAYPGMKEAMEAAGKEMKKVEGVAVRTVTYVVLVPPEKKFDRELALAGKNEKGEEKSGGGLGKTLGGMLGPKKKADSEQPAEMKQNTIMSVTSELRDAQAGGVPADAFTVPADFKEQKWRE